ncbi:MAG TPA: hypothetical protein VKQ34_02075 [Candidatus Saccharimonadales bacterium]|nr:hypothetical protein [Candidatus Saccharimonadales bacterium]
MASKTERKAIDKVFILLGGMATLVLLGASVLGYVGYKFATSEVKNELSAQKVYFPPKGSPALDPAEFPTLQQYAGQLVDNGPKAKAYANDFIAVHLQKVAGGKTYAEVSTLALQNPTDQKLQQQKATLFQGETLRGLLLGDGYAYWTFGMMALYASVGTLAAAVVMAILVLLGLRHLRQLR